MAERTPTPDSVSARIPEEKSNVSAKEKPNLSWADSMSLADRAVAALHGKGERREKWEAIQEELCEKLGIVQLEIMPRDLLSHDRSRYLVGTVRNGVDGLYLPNGAGRADSAETRDAVSSSFRELLKQINTYAPSFYEDLLRSFDRTFETVPDGPRNRPGMLDEIIVVKDGEASFFSMMWLYRRAYSLSGGIEGLIEWLTDPQKTLKLDFRFENSTGSWGDITAEALYIKLGLIAKLPDGRIGITDRLSNLDVWLGHQSRYAKVIRTLSLPSNEELDLALDALSFKSIPSDEIDDGLKNWLRAYFVWLLEQQDEQEQKEKPALRDPYETFLEFYKDRISPFFEPTHSKEVLQILSACPPELQKPPGTEDRVILKLPQCGFLPLEYLLRCAVREPMQLLILPFDFEDRDRNSTTGDLQTNRTPKSLAFVTLCRAIPKEVCDALCLSGTKLEGALRQWEEEAPANTGDPPAWSEASAKSKLFDDITKGIGPASDFIQPYHTLLSRLNHDFTASVLDDQVRATGQEASVSAITHEVSHLMSWISHRLVVDNPQIQDEATIHSLQVYREILEIVNAWINPRFSVGLAKDCKTIAELADKVWRLSLRSAVATVLIRERRLQSKTDFEALNRDINIIEKTFPIRLRGSGDAKIPKDALGRFVRLFLNLFREHLQHAVVGSPPELEVLHVSESEAQRVFVNLRSWRSEAEVDSADSEAPESARITEMRLDAFTFDVLEKVKNRLRNQALRIGMGSTIVTNEISALNLRSRLEWRDPEKNNNGIFLLSFSFI